MYLFLTKIPFESKRPSIVWALVGFLCLFAGLTSSTFGQTLPHMIDINWSLGPNLPQGFQDSDGGIIDNTLITAGGFAAGETIPGKVYPRGFVHETWGLDLTDPQADWVSLPDFPGSNEPSNVDGAGRQELASVVVNNEIYAWGGFNYTSPFAYADGHRLSHDGGVWAWNSLPSLPHAVSSPGITAIGDFIYSVGGSDYDSTAFYTATDRNGGTPGLGSKFHRLDTTDLQAGWTALPDLPGVERWVHSTTAVGDQLYVFGGATGGPPYRSVVDNWRYDTTTGDWHQLADLPVSSGNFSNGQVVVDDRYILLIGGFQYEEVRNPDGTVGPKYGQATKTIPGNVYFSDVWVYDTLTDQFGTATQLPNNNNLPMAVVEGNKLYLLGGETGGFTFDGEQFGHHPESVFIGDMTVVMDPSVTLFVDHATGAVRMENVSAAPLNIDGYEVSSQLGSLDPSDGQWQSLEDAGVHPGWLEIGTPTINLLAELNADGATTLDPGSSLALGTPYTLLATEFGQSPSTGDLVFGFSTDGGDVITGNVVYEGAINNLVLLVDPATGEAALTNPSPFNVLIDAYEISSEDDSLDPTDWDSLETNPATPNWIEIETPTDGLLAELNADSSTEIVSGAQLLLGDIFKIGGMQDLEFEFSIFDGSIMSGIVQYGQLPSTEIPGDYNGDGGVGIEDYTVWRDALGQAGVGLAADGNGDLVVDELDYEYWKARFGIPPSGANLAVGVPEPSSSVVAMIAITSIFLATRSPLRFAASDANLYTTRFRLEDHTLIRRQSR
ncbi:MAG: kelch repeat-containing protein [Aeoliella sp.]